MRPLGGSRVLLFVVWLGLCGVGQGQEGEDERLSQLRAAIAESRERVGRTEREERGLLEALEALDRSLSLLTRDVAATQKRADEARRSLEKLEGEAVELTRTLEQTRDAMGRRAAALYRAGEIGAVRLLFSAEGLRGFLTRVAALRLLLTHDADLIRRHREQVAGLEIAEAQARQASERRDEALARLRERKGELATERAAKRRLAERLQESRRLERRTLVELERAGRALEETLEGLGGARAGDRVEIAGASFASRRRALDPPVAGRITQRFGRIVDPEFQTETFNRGIRYAAAAGTPVRAVARAQVRFAGWFRGYGRLVILDHGEAYFSVSGHLEEISVSLGESVDADGVIGTVGETGSLDGPRLYFEIRRGGEALDPGEWLRSAN